MKIAVLLSGGVDSSVALHRILEQGYTDVTAFYLKIWLEEEFSFLGACPWEVDMQFARQVCAQAGVPFEVISLQSEYYEKVVSYTVEELRKGGTPSPDIFCNQRIKFGAFREKVGDTFDKVATGHYGRILERDGLHWLLRGVDPVKDQTYFLSHLHQDQLALSLFPVGDLLKNQVRELAERYDLPNARRKDSQGICFLGKIKFNEFVMSYLGERIGEIREKETGRKLGDHRGYWFHTIGQRRGLGLSMGPWFVVDKDIDDNIVFVSHQETMADHHLRSFPVADPHWITRPPARSDLLVKLRHTPHLGRCRLDRDAGERWMVTLDEADSGVASGQYSVFYEGETCLGGARIIAESP